MKIYVIVSPDKLSMSMFSDYLKTILGNFNVELFDINHLNSNEIKDSIIQSYADKFKDTKSILIAKYKIKSNTQVSDLSVILPEKVQKLSDYIIRFDLFSQQPIVVKDSDNTLPGLVDRYLVNLKKFEK